MARQTTELSELSLAGLVQELRESKQEALNLRFRNATGQLENTAEIKRVRRQIARINTLIRQREITEAESVSGAAK
jgi:large subunit ribosomal protein L29